MNIPLLSQKLAPDNTDTLLKLFNPGDYPTTMTLHKETKSFLIQ